MKKILLIVIIILQSLFCLSYACELKIENQSDTMQLQSGPSKNILSNSISNSEHHREGDTERTQTQCDKCEFCSHLGVNFINVTFDFHTNDFFSPLPNYKFSYQQPIISFSQKPPIHS